ncbi:hypothetical protein Pcinc_026995 [Petrolisthes cinctipes]|uniref:Uncharacterized protein n=1 Tax=Petrolisthes cinctipes TaxID=88211 RepID=A0AAE1F4U3_PETCI|nr:hypothetical protein Pcinc_026995 [Petrolisthes cinctipes]
MQSREKWSCTVDQPVSHQHIFPIGPLEVLPSSCSLGNGGQRLKEVSAFVTEPQQQQQLVTTGGSEVSPSRLLSTLAG